MGAKWGCLDGFWIRPDGSIIDKTDQNHADIVLMYIPGIPQDVADAYLERAPGDSSYDMKIVDYGLQEGWIRVLFEEDEEVAVEYHPSRPPRTAWSVLHRYIGRETLANRYVFSVPDGLAAEFFRKADAVRFVGAQMR